MFKQTNNKRQRWIKQLRIAAAAALYIGGSSWIGLQADDTQIYINKLPKPQTPNVLFTIDTSGSMGWEVPGGGQTKIEAVKDALTGLVNDTSNLKAGLARFHRDLGGPIIFPVVNLDDTPAFLNDTQSVSSIDSSSDDAEEAAGVVYLDDPALELTQANTGGGSVELFTRQSSDSNDDDEDGTGRYALDSDDLDIGEEDAGVRFSNVDIPNNAVILHAEIEFEAAVGHSEETHVEIFGHDVDNSPPFVENGNNDIDDRENEVTSASVDWSNIISMTAGQIVTTPNLRTIVKEIVGRSDWISGNDMSFLLEDEGGLRELTTVDGGRGAILRVQYLTSATSSEYYINGSRRDAGETGAGSLITDFNGFYLMGDSSYSVDHELSGLIFRNIDIPSGAVVQWADITWTTRNERDAVASNLEIRGILQDDPSDFTGSNKISDRPLTTEVITWDGLLSQGDEEIFAPTDGDPLTTPNLALLIEAVRTGTAHQSGDNLGFVIQDAPGGGVASRHMCSFDGGDNENGCDDSLDARPKLRLVYSFPTPTATVQQQVGLRFNNVRVPQGATIDSAHLEFTVESETTESGELSIKIENSTTPATYSASAPVSGRAYDGTPVPWTTDIWDTIGERQQSPDISSLVSQVTDNSAWCGGGSLAFRITSADAQLIAESFDKGGSGAPTLRVNYNTDNLSAGEGCTTRQTSVDINDSDNDVEEHSDGDMDFDSGDLDIEPGYLVGLRFEDVDVPLGATITGANLILTGDDQDSGTAEIEIQAQQHPNAPPFVDADGDLSSRVGSGDPTVTWDVTETWEEDGRYGTQDDGKDITPLIADIIDGTVKGSGDEQWAAGNALVFTLDGKNTNDRDAEVCCGSDRPSTLEISYQVKLGDLPGTGGVTGRDAILSIIDDLVASGNTPEVDALFESGAYFEGDPVHYGRTRGAGASFDGNGQTDGDLDSNIRYDDDYELLDNGHLSRLSHPATYTPSPVNIIREGSCSETNPNNSDCDTERMDAGASPDYVSPFNAAESCERGFLVLLSDGIANRNSSRELIKTLTGQASCPLDIPEIDDDGNAILSGSDFQTRNPSSDEMCGLELADYMYGKDYIDEGGGATDVRNNVKTFTIGFDLTNTGDRDAVEFLKALAFVGSGGNLDDPDGVDGVKYGDGFYTASSAQELQDVFEIIVQSITKETTSFVAPGISTNAFNRLFNLDDIYFSLFQPSDSTAWRGNLKKFKLCTDQASCDFGETIDVNAAPAVNDSVDANGEPLDPNTFGTLKTTAQGFWSEADDDAPVINQGGAGEKIPTWTDRNVYVVTDGGAVTAPDYDGDSWVQGTAPHKIDVNSDTDATPGNVAGFNALKTALRERGNCGSGDLDTQNDCLNELIEWITGRKFDGDEPRDGTESDVDRWAFGDPMHSRPLVLTYGKYDGGTANNPDDDVPLSKIIVGTNDGGVRLINEGDGVEEWIFYPYSMLGMQSDLKDNPRGVHEYGIDDTPTARLKNVDGDGIIEPADGDFVHLYFGLRRGGRQIFALNATPSSTIGLATTQTVGSFTAAVGQKGKIAPELLWRIDGNDPKFQRLGMTWSTPRPVRIAGPSGPRTVLIFGGGYDPQQDGEDTDSTTPDGGDQYNSSANGDAQGNAIFIVDADTGERLWWASSDVDGNGDAADASVAAMNTSIAAPVTTLDSNGDGLTDRLYAVDLRGQLFRVNIAQTLADSSVGLLAQLGPDESAIPSGEQAPNADRRKFLYAPEVARVQDTGIVEASYELIGLVSGNRSNPQGKTVQDRAYAVRDFLTGNPSAGLTTSNFPACNPGATSCTNGAVLTNADLTDVSEQGAFVIRDLSQGNVSLSNASGSDLGSTDPAVLNLSQSDGWYFDLQGENFNVTDPELTGEKGFSSVTVLDGKMFFTTFLPPDQTADNTDACSVPEALGTSRFYAVDFFTGAPAFDRNTDSTFEEAERFKNLGAGPSADIVPAYLPGGVTLPVPTGAGAIAEDPDVEQYNKTFWLEER